MLSLSLILVVRTGFEPDLGLTTYDILFTTTPCRHLTICYTLNSINDKSPLMSLVLQT